MTSSISKWKLAAQFEFFLQTEIRIELKPPILIGYSQISLKCFFFFSSFEHLTIRFKESDLNIKFLWYTNTVRKYNVSQNFYVSKYWQLIKLQVYSNPSFLKKYLQITLTFDKFTHF